MRSKLLFMPSTLSVVLLALIPEHCAHAQCYQYDTDPTAYGHSVVNARLGYELSTPLQCVEYQIPEGIKFIALRAKYTRLGVETARLTLRADVNGQVKWAPLNETPISTSELAAGFLQVSCGQGCTENARWRFIRVGAETASGPATLAVYVAATGEELSTNSLNLDVEVWHKPRFLLTSTDRNFVPRDAADTAANCSLNHAREWAV